MRVRSITLAIAIILYRTTKKRSIALNPKIKQRRLSDNFTRGKREKCDLKFTMYISASDFFEKYVFIVFAKQIR